MQLAELFGGQSESFYKTEMMTNLLQEFWKKDKKMIIWRQFLPFVLYLTVSTFQYFYGLKER